jgi:hypothetical protein
MKKVLVILAALALVATASASVRVFVTPALGGTSYGLTIPANHNVATYTAVDSDGNVTAGGQDYYSGAFVAAAWPPQAAPSGTFGSPVTIAPGDWAYIWFEFQAEPAGAKIVGLQITVSDATTNITTPTSELGFTYYFQNDALGTGNTRANSEITQPGAPQYHKNPQSILSLTATGIQNVPSASGVWNMGKRYVAGESMYLLGAIDGGAVKALKTYKISITTIEYSSGTPGTPVDGYFAITPLPEPASLLLMGLAGLLLRRR